MNRFELTADASIWVAAVAGSVLTASDHRWFRGTFAAFLVGLAVICHRRNFLSGRQLWVLTILGVASGIAVYVIHASMEPVCTARNASGERVVIGTEFTQSGAKYHHEHPNDDADAILESLGGLGPQLAWTAASIQHCRLKLLVTGTLWMPFFGVALAFGAGLVRQSTFARSGVLSESARARDGKKKVFISYSHEDVATAVRIRDLIRQNNWEAIIDMDSMPAGERIHEFIERSVREADAVVSIVSTNSLLSAWVAMETINTLNRTKPDGKRVLVPCYLSDDFFRAEFRLECTRKIDERLEAIERLTSSYAAQKIDPVDLHEEKSRLYDLRNNLGAILAALKGSLCLDLRDSHFGQSGALLLAAISQNSCP